MTINSRFVTIAYLIPLLLACQNKSEDCRIAKRGTFYFYPRKTSQQFQIIRTDSLQTELDLITGDSSFWNIKWENECTFNLSFVRDTRVMSDKEREFYNSHVLNCKILAVAPTYYIFKAIADPGIGFQPVTDTMWLVEKKMASSGQ